MDMKQWVTLLKSDAKNWDLKPSIPDSRDKLYPISSVAAATKVRAASMHNLVNAASEAVDFKQTGPLCSAYAIAGAMNAYLHNLGMKPPGGLSKKYLYWMTKQIDGIPEQEGTYIRSVLKVALHNGVCSEAAMPTVDESTPPTFTEDMHRDAAKYRIKSYHHLNNWDEITDALASGMLVTVGTLVTDINWADGYLIEPEGRVLGFHGHTLHGYNLDQRYLEKGVEYLGFLDGINSWGPEWGFDGHYYMAKHYAEFSVKGFGMPALLEAWAINFDVLPKPIVSEAKTEKVVTKEFLVAPQVIEGRTMLPVRELAEDVMGYAVDYDAINKKVTLWGEGKKIEMVIGQKEYTITDI